MSEPSKMTVKIDIGQPDRPGPSRLVTLDRMVEWIKKQELDDYTQNGLIELAKRYPTAALPSFRRNYNLMIQRVRAKRRIEQNGEAYDEKAENIEPVSEDTDSLESAFRKAFKPRDEGPEFIVARRPLFDEPQKEAGTPEESTESTPGIDSGEPVQSQTFESEEWEEKQEPKNVVTNDDDSAGK